MRTDTEGWAINVPEAVDLRIPRAPAEHALASTAPGPNGADLGVCERANYLLKTTFKALREVSLDPGHITKIAAAALVPLQLEYDRTI